VTRILHISDIHWDQDYMAGLSNDCGEPICCRPPNKPGTRQKIKIKEQQDVSHDSPHFSPVLYTFRMDHNHKTRMHIAQDLFSLPGNGSSAAGPWGDYGCDLPYSTLINLMEYLRTIKDKVHKFIRHINSFNVNTFHFFSRPFNLYSLTWCT